MKYVISESQIMKIYRFLHEEESKEDNIKKIQQFLVDKDYDLGDYGENEDGVDGKYGPLTKKAVEDFQKKQGNLEIDGKVGPDTAKAMGDNIESIFKKKSKSDKSKKSDDEKPKTDFLNTTNDDEYIIIKPKNYSGNKVHVFFGGHSTNPSYSKNGANMSAMKKYINILSPYATNTVIVITHHMNTLGNVKKYVAEKFGGVVNSIAGFSQGGKETWKHASNSSLGLVGLVDPSTYEKGLSFGANTILYCDPKNWGTSGFYGETRERLEWYCEHKKDYGNKVVCFNQGGTHMNFRILIDFYSKYGSKI